MLSNVGRIAFLFALLALVTPAPSPAWADDAAKKTEQTESGHADAGHSETDGHDEADHEEAGHGDGHEGDGTPVLLQEDIGASVVNLAIFLGVLGILSKFVWPVILDGLKARESKIFGELKAAEQANTEAKTLLADYQTKLDDAATQVQTMLAEARKDAESSGQRIVEESKAEAERQRERAIAEIETAKQVAISDLAGQTSDMAINIAKQVVGRELKAGDHADLIRKSLNSLPSNN
jgi:F-type H+-transporting ATPase subunit b